MRTYLRPALLLALAPALAYAAAETPVQLRLRLSPGTEFVRRVEAVVRYHRLVARMEETGEARVTGEIRCLVVETDPATSGTLLGALSAIDLSISRALAHDTIKGRTPRGEETRARRQRLVCAFRVSPLGALAPRSAREERSPTDAARAAIFRTLYSAVVPGPGLPDGPVQPGAAWQAPALAGFPHAPAPCVEACTLSALKVVDGRRCAVIRGVLSPAAPDAPGARGVSLSGESETLFDVDRGVPVERRLKFTTRLSSAVGGEQADVEATIRLVALRPLGQAEFAREARRVRALDAALDLLDRDQVDGAVEGLVKLRASEADADWKQGLDEVLSLAQQLQALVRRGSDRAAGPAAEEKLIQDSEAAAQKGDWKTAAEKLLSFADKWPGHRLAPLALGRAASIYEKELKDPKTSEALRRRLRALDERKTAPEKDTSSSPLQTYELANSYADAFQLVKAIETYRKFVAAPAPGLDPKWKLMAQYRIGRLLEKMLRPEEAVAAYRAVEKLPGDDEECKHVRQLAAARAAELAAPKKP